MTEFEPPAIDPPLPDVDQQEDTSPRVERRDAPLRSASVYALSAAMPRAISFILLPLYTRAIDPAQYGTVSLLLSAASGVGILLTLGLDIAIFRSYFELADDPRRQDEFVGSVWRFLLVFPLGSALLIGGTAWVFLGDSGRFKGLDILLALVSTALGVGATTLPLAILRASQRLRPYLAITGVTTIATSASTLVLVVVLHDGVRGWLVATVIANGATLAAACALMPWHRRTPYRGALVRGALLLGIPLVPHFFSYWALQVADRSVLAGLVTPTALGVYSLASNLALPVMILVQSLNQGFMPTYARAGTRAGEVENLGRVVELQASLVTAICTGAAILAEPLVSIVAPRAYWGAGSLVAWIMLGYGFLGLYYIPMNGVALAAGRTRFVWVATSLSAATNIGLLFALVPSGGIKAAAIASAIGYAVLLVTIFIYANRPDNPVRYRWPQLVAIFGTGTALFAGASLTAPAHGVMGLGLRTLWCLSGLGVYALFRGRCVVLNAVRRR